MNFGNEEQMMTGVDKEYGFISNFDMPWPFTSRKTELPHESCGPKVDPLSRRPHGASGTVASPKLH